MVESACEIGARSACRRMGVRRKRAPPRALLVANWEARGGPRVRDPRGPVHRPPHVHSHLQQMLGAVGRWPARVAHAQSHEHAWLGLGRRVPASQLHLRSMEGARA
eukprot:3133188-Prymnesium_polylepis.2